MGMFLLLPSSVYAAEPFFRSGEEVVIAEDIDGPAFIAGGSVTIDGDISGDLVVAGGEVIINGDIMQDIYAAGGQITFNSAVDGNVVVAGGQITIDEDALIGENLLVGAGMVRQLGQVFGSAWYGAGRVNLNGEVIGNATVGSEELVLGDTALVGGNLVGQTSTEPVIANSAAIEGDKSIQVMPEEERINKEQMTKMSGVSIFWRVGKKIVSWAGLALLFVWLLPKNIPPVVKKLTPFGNALGQGSVVLLFGALLSVGTMITLLGLPLGGLIITSIMLGLTVGRVFPTILLGQKLISKQPLWQQALVGGVVGGATAAVPLLGWLASLVVGIWGLGALWQTLRSA